MANHAKVITKSTLDPYQVDELVQNINYERFGGVFTLDFGVNVVNGWGKYQWVLSYKNEPYIGLVFWLSDDVKYGYEEDGKWIESDDEIIVSKQSCIEFRHGHSFDFMWWVEGVFRETLGEFYDAQMWDDGVGDCGEPRPERYKTFKDYVCNDETDPEIVKQLKGFRFNSQMSIIPKELIDKLKLDF